jgi:uncharacterized protein
MSEILLLTGPIDLEALDQFLISDGAPPNSMGVSDLDGFLTGIAIGPETILPSEWLPVIWGGDEPVFDSADEARSVLGTIMGRYNEIIRSLDANPVAYTPIYWEGPSGEVIAPDLIAADWAEGFVDAMQLRPDAWEPLFKARHGSIMLMPILALCSGHEGASPLEIDPVKDVDLLVEAADQIPASVIAIHAFWKERRGRAATGTSRPQSAKVGRNDPCPCGSGRKHKRCCGAN